MVTRAHKADRNAPWKSISVVLNTVTKVYLIRFNSYYDNTQSTTPSLASERCPDNFEVCVPVKYSVTKGEQTRLTAILPCQSKG